MKFYVHKDFVTSFSFLVSYCRCSSTSSLGVVLAPRSFLESFSILPSSFQFLYPTPVFPPAGVFLDPSPSFLNHPSIFGWFFVSLSPFFLRLSSLSFFFFAFVSSFLRILPQQNTALLSHVCLSVCLSVCDGRDMSIYANIYTDFEH